MRIGLQRHCWVCSLHGNPVLGPVLERTARLLPRASFFILSRLSLSRVLLLAFGVNFQRRLGQGPLH